MKLLRGLLLLSMFAAPSYAEQRSYTAQEIANGAGIIYNRELRTKVVQGPTMTFRDVGKGNVGYAMWGVMTPQGPYFRLVGLPYGNMRKVNAVRLEGFDKAPEFTPQKRLVNVQIGFGKDVYDFARKNGLTVHLHGDVDKSFTVPVAYFRGFHAWWKKTYE